MLNIARYRTKIFGAYNITKYALSRQCLFTNARTNIIRCNDISLKKYYSSLLQKVINSFSSPICICVAHMTRFAFSIYKFCDILIDVRINFND